MKIPLRQLQRHLESKLANVYLVAGDEPLLVGEALEQIRSAARRAGFEERDVHVVDRSFRWDELASGADNLSLFATRKILELRLPSPRPGDAGSRGIRGLLERPDPDRLLVIAVAGKLDAAAAGSVWAKAIDKAGVLVEIWPVERAELPRWIRERAARHKLKLTPAAAELLADRIEGNLLAAEQELMKLALNGHRAEIDEADVLDAVADSARFDVFLLTDAMLGGDAVRAVRVLHGLRAEGAQPVLVSWALSRELSLLAALKFAILSGDNLDSAFNRQRVWRRRQPLVEKALRRIEWEPLKVLLAQAVELDGLVKGVSGARPWDAITRLVLAAIEAQRTSRRTAA